MIVLPLVAFGCDSLFDDGDVENTYDGPDQVAFFPLESNPEPSCLTTTSGVVEVQFISSNGLANSGVSVSFSAGALSTANAGVDYNFVTSSPLTIPAGSASADIDLEYPLERLESFTIEADDFDSARAFGTYEGLAFTGGSGTGGTLDVTVPAFGEITAVADTAAAGDTLRTAGEYALVQPTGGSGTGAYFSVTIGATGTVDVAIDTAGTRYLATDTLTVAAADIGGTGSDLILAVGGVSATAPPSVSVASTGTGYECTDVLTIPDSDLGGAGAPNFQFEVLDLDPAFDDEARILLQITSSDVKVAANLDTANVYIQQN